MDCHKNQVDSLKRLHASRGCQNLLITIDDCRFENEFHAFPDALRVRLTCDKAVRKERCSEWRENDKHLSETSLDGFSKENMFDLNLGTEHRPVGDCVSLIRAQLDKNVWVEKRSIK